VKNQVQESKEFTNSEYFQLGGQDVARGYGSVSDDGSYLHAVVKLKKVYTLGESVLADIQWSEGEENRQTVEIGNSGDLNYISITKQSSREIFPVSSDMVTTRVESKSLVFELEPYLNQDVIMGFFIAAINSDKYGGEVQDYIKALQPYIECNENFYFKFDGRKPETSCRPFSHVIYVVQN
jgi:hypothetical protein